MDDNVVVETKANQNNSTKVNKTDSDAAVIEDGTNTAVDVNVVHHIHRIAGMPLFEQGKTPVDMSSLPRPPRPQCPLVPTTVIPPKVKPVYRSMKAGKIFIRTKAAIIGGRLKRPMLEIEPF